MSSSDIRDILQIGKRSEAPQQRKPKQSTEKRPEKYNREVYSLTGAIAPDAFVPPTYKAKFNVKKKPTPWVLQSFKNPERNDELELQHWIKRVDADKPGYPFARSEKDSGIIQYTDKEYAKDLKDPGWTKEETDYLMKLCQHYDLRFFVIADRYEFDPHHKRSIDDLKERFYNIQQILYHKTHGKGSASHSTFDKARELERKHALNKLYNRTKEQEQEEMELLVEVKRIEQNQLKFAKERENLQEMLRQHEISIIPVNKRSTAKDKKRKRKSSGEEEESSEKLAQGVFVRSQKLPSLKPSIQAKVTKVLNELSTGTRPVMPTASVCESFERLENSIVTLFELKKVVDKMEIEHRIVKGP